MDVYALSPYARFLALPHMVTPACATRLRAGLPPPPWRAIIDEAHAIFGLDKTLIAAVIRVESNFQAGAGASRGAQGAMQLMPGTQADLGLIDPFDPRVNVYAGKQYLKKQLDRFGRVDLAPPPTTSGPPRWTNTVRCRRLRKRGTLCAGLWPLGNSRSFSLSDAIAPAPAGGHFSCSTG